MRRLLKLFPIDAADADRAAAEIRSLFNWPDMLAAIAYAAFFAIMLPAALLFFGMIGRVL